MPCCLCEIDARLARIERLLIAVSWAQRTEEKSDMATQATLAQLKAGLRKNTDIVASTKAALTHYAQSTAELTAKLQAALEGGDEAEVKAAADALDANNAELLASVPEVTGAVIDGTGAPNPGNVQL